MKTQGYTISPYQEAEERLVISEQKIKALTEDAACAWKNNHILERARKEVEVELAAAQAEIAMLRHMLGLSNAKATGVPPAPTFERSKDAHATDGR